MDTLGHLLALAVTPPMNKTGRKWANWPKRAQAEVEEPVKVAFVDQGYTGEQPKEAAAQQGIELLVVKTLRRGQARLCVVAPTLGGGTPRLGCPIPALGPGLRERLATTFAGYHWLAFVTLMPVLYSAKVTAGSNKGCKCRCKTITVKIECDGRILTLLL